MRIRVGLLDIFIYYFVALYFIFGCQSENTELDIANGNSSMDAFVYSLTDNLLLWNDYVSNSNEPHQRVRRSEFQIETEYISIECNLYCWIQTLRSEGLGQIRNTTHNVLMCRYRHSPSLNGKKNVLSPVKLSCIAHKLGSLLHITISPNVIKSNSGLDDTNVDYLSEGFSVAIRTALMSMMPIPETLYMTLDIPVRELHSGDFKYLSQWLRRLSLLLTRTQIIDKSLLQDLSLDSFTADGCDFAGLSIQDAIKEQVCTVDFLYSCPERDYVILVADKTTHRHNCKEQLEIVNAVAASTSMQGDEPLRPVFQCPQEESTNIGCNCEDIKAMLAAFKEHNQPRDNFCTSQYSAENLLYISLWINGILSASLIGIVIIAFFLFSYYRTKHRTAISVEHFGNSKISKLF